MARRIIKKLGGDRIGSGNKMTVSAAGYGYSTHDVGCVTRTSMSFGTIVPMGQWLLTAGSRLRIRLDALITSNALLYQLYGSAKFQVDVFSARMALYNPKMLLNLNDQGYEISDIKFPLYELETRGHGMPISTIPIQQIDTSALIRYLGVAANGQNFETPGAVVKRKHNAMWLLMYYQVYKEYYANKQEKVGVIIHNGTGSTTQISQVITNNGGAGITWGLYPDEKTVTVEPGALEDDYKTTVFYSGTDPDLTGAQFHVITVGGQDRLWSEVWDTMVIDTVGNTVIFSGLLSTLAEQFKSFKFVALPTEDQINLVEFDLKAVDRMMMKIMAEVESDEPLLIDGTTELPYGASFIKDGEYRAINSSQEALGVGTYQSDVFNNWLDNTTINNLNAKSKVKVDINGEFSIDMLNITQKMYNYDMRIGVTDGTLDEWREMTYAQVGKSKSLKPVYEGGLSKEIVFDMVVSTAGTDDDPLGSIASRGAFGNKHKGGYVQIDSDEEKLVMVLAKITPRLVYNQGNDWTTNLKTLDDLHKPIYDKIGYQNLSTDTMAAFETLVKADGSLVEYSAGKQPAWQWYRTNYDRALGNMASTESYKVFGREYEVDVTENPLRIKDLTTYIDPRKFNDVFAIQSLDAMNFDVQVGMDATLTLVMSEEVIPNL